MEYQHYLYISSIDSLNLYPTNSPGQFYCKLPQPLNLRGLWECGLIQLQFVNSYFAGTDPPKCFYVCSDICTESVLLERKIPVLRRISNMYGTEMLNKTVEIKKWAYHLFDLFVIECESAQSVHIVRKAYIRYDKVYRNPWVPKEPAYSSRVYGKVYG